MRYPNDQKTVLSEYPVTEHLDQSKIRIYTCAVTSLVTIQSSLQIIKINEIIVLETEIDNLR